MKEKKIQQEVVYRRFIMVIDKKIHIKNLKCIKQENSLCTNCEACINICPNNAISTIEDEFGFKYPTIDPSKCINCNLCEHICKNIDYVRKNKYITSIVAQSKNWNLSKKSSSGGMFAQIAKYILSKNGVVFGCTMEKINNKFDVKHIYIDDEKDLYRLQGSKYVQSNIKNTYKEAKQFLEQNRLVLFSGTPCQIAGLKAYLGKDYEKLLTVDLSCEGVPSLKMFNDYISFLEKNKIRQEIIDFKFRDKSKFGWSTAGFSAITKNKKILLFQDLSSYFSLFIKGHILRNSCYNCSYTGLNRISDITIADAWGIEEEYPKLLKTKFNKNKGISLILINTQKGEIFFNNIQNKLIIENINVNKLKKYNHPLRHPSIKQESREIYLNEYKHYGYMYMDKLFRKKMGKMYYYYLLKRFTPKYIKNIIRKIKNLNNKKVDCLLLTWFNWKNYGSILTAFALYKVIENLGYSIMYINNHTPLGYAKDFNKKYTKKTHFCINNKDYEKLNKISNTFIVGSDNQLDFKSLGLNTYRNLLDFANKTSKKLLFAGSFGSWDWDESEDIMKNLESLYNRFDYLSTREKYSTKLLNEKFGVNSEWLIEPVCLLGKEDYYKLIECSKTKDYKSSIMKYVLYPNKECDLIIEHLKNKYNLKKEVFLGNDLAPNIQFDKNKSVENWLKAIRDSRYIVTDSFHCVVFAILFNRPVICIKNKNDTRRFKSLFKKINIDIPIYSSFSEYQTTSPKEINWDNINKQINIIKFEVINKIKTQLENNIIKTNIQNENEKIFEDRKKYFYNKHDLFYKKNAWLYEYFFYPVFANFVTQYRKRKKI